MPGSGSRRCGSTSARGCWRSPLAADVGGGNGALLIGILRANTGLRGIVFDLAHVAERAREQLKEAGIVDRCEVVAGSFFDEVPRGADAYLLKHVIHDWDDERATAILKNCRKAIPPAGKVLIVEGIYPARIEESLEGGEERGRQRREHAGVTVHGARVTAVQTGIGPGRTRGFARLSPRPGRRFSGGGIGHGPSPRPGRAGEAFSSTCFRPQSDRNYRQ
jgi:SAM-dependent methyltransferase